MTGHKFDVKAEWVIPTDEELASIITSTIQDVKDIKFAHSFRYYTTFIVIESKENEYLIPYTSTPDINGLINGKIYTSDEVVSIMSGIYNETAAIKAGDLDGGTPIKSTQNIDSNLLLLTTVSLILSAITATLIFRAKKIKA